MWHAKTLRLLLSLFLFGGILALLLSIPSQKSDHAIQARPTDSLTLRAADREKGNTSLFARIRESMVYLWKDRIGCSGIMIHVPEITPARRVALTSGHCITSDPLRRDKKNKFPRLQLMSLGQLRNGLQAEFLSDTFFSAENLDTTEYEIERLADDPLHGFAHDPKGIFLNSQRDLALYHDDFPRKAYFPQMGILHQDFFSLYRFVDTPHGTGLTTILHHYNLALIDLDPPPPFLNSDTRLLTLRRLPSETKEGDTFYRVHMGRSGIRREMVFDVKDVTLSGFSQKHGLLQVCEEPVVQEKEFVSDMGSALVLVREGEPYFLGMSAYGSPVAKRVKEKNCMLTTFTHLAHHMGWMKIASAQLRKIQPHADSLE